MAARQGISASLRRLGGFLIVAAGMAWGPAHAGDVFKGHKIYSTYCANCHGPAGGGVMPGAPDLSNIQTLMQPDMALLGSLKAGSSGMPAYLGILTDRDLLDVIAYLRTLAR
jgi:cytochrome c6